MAIDYNLVTLSGTIATSEIWTTSCAFQTNFGTGPVTSFDDLQAWADAIAALATPSASYPTLYSALSNRAQLTTVRTAYIAADGVTQQAAETLLGTPWAPGTAAKMPFQCSMVLSLLTGRPGRSYRGRMYWPAFSLDVSGTTLAITPAQSQLLANEMSELLTDIGGAAGSEALMMPVVRSDKLGITTFVTQIRCGTVVDTQRRRRNSAPEAYSSAVVPPAA